MLAKPTNLQLTKGLVISIVQSLIKGHPDAVVPDKVDNYHLIRKLNKENVFNPYAVGLYQHKHKGEKVFIKTWNGNFKNLGYYFLINEYIASKILYKKLESHSSTKKSGIRTPKLIQYIVSEHSLSLVFEYVEGKTLTSYRQNEQVVVLSRVIKTLLEISDTLTDQEKQRLSSRGKSFYILSLPVFTLLTIISNPRSYKVVSRAFISCLRTLKLLKKTNLYIAHRDISLDNIIVSKQGIFIVDWEEMVLTVADYDITYLSLNPYQKLTIDLLSSKLSCRSNLFLKNYLLIQKTCSYAYPKEFENHYLRELYKLYC